MLRELEDSLLACFFVTCLPHRVALIRIEGADGKPAWAHGNGIAGGKLDRGWAALDLEGALNGHGHAVADARLVHDDRLIVKIMGQTELSGE